MTDVPGAYFTCRTDGNHFDCGVERRAIVNRPYGTGYTFRNLLLFGSGFDGFHHPAAFADG
jgi:hypothetical protein